LISNPTVRVSYTYLPTTNKMS